MRLVATYFNYRKHNYKKYLHNKYKYGIELAKNSEYDVVCKVECDDSSGTGILIQSETGIKAILTAAHVISDDKTYYISFIKDNFKRKVINTKFLNDDHKEGLVILKLDNYPDNIIPIVLNNIKIKNETFLHTAGYGCFLKQERWNNIIHHNCDIIHVVSGMYKIKDSIK